MSAEKFCSRCYSKCKEVFAANCFDKPELLKDSGVGMYHCEDCGAMVVAGVPHGPLCKLCHDRAHPDFDEPQSNDHQAAIK